MELEFDPKVTSYENLLQIFWNHHDPCAVTPNTDEKHRTTQYMSLLLYHTPAQKAAAEASLAAEQAKRGEKKVLTKILDANEYPLTVAENYHEKYILQQHPSILKSLGIAPGPALRRSYVCCRLNGYLAGYGTLGQFEKELPSLGLPADVKKYMLDLFRKGIRVDEGKMIDDFFEERDKNLAIQKMAISCSSGKCGFTSN